MEYTTVIAEGDLAKLEQAAQYVLSKLPHRVTMEPAAGLIMVKHIDPLEQTPFYLGEVYVTHCEIEVDGLLGYSCVLGRAIKRARAGAALDAVLGNGHELALEVRRLLDPVAAEIEQKWREERKDAALTKVNFDVKKG